jgi:hypothetical protein
MTKYGSSPLSTGTVSYDFYSYRHTETCRLKPLNLFGSGPGHALAFVPGTARFRTRPVTG